MTELHDYHCQPLHTNLLMNNLQYFRDSTGHYNVRQVGYHRDDGCANCSRVCVDRLHT